MTATYNMRPVSPSSGPHGFLAYAGSRPSQSDLRSIGLQLANHYFKKKGFARKQWGHVRPEVCRWEETTPSWAACAADIPPPWKVEVHTSPKLRLKNIEDALQTGRFDFKSLGLPDPACWWLDSSLAAWPKFLALSTDGTHALEFAAITPLGSKFPVVPALDREGFLSTSFQITLVQRISRLRERLVSSIGTQGDAEWFQDFRALMADCVTLIENTTTLLYLTAQYAPQPGWTFDSVKLGDRIRPGVMDKLRWVTQITGARLEATKGRTALEMIRVVRNHLQHADPPIFACTWEDMTGLLNCVPRAAQLAREIRTCAGALPSSQLIELLLQRPVVFRARDPGRKRIVQPPNVGYASASALAMQAAGPPDRKNAITFRPAPPIRIL